MHELPSGAVVLTFGSSGSEPLQFNSMLRVCFAVNGNLIVTDYGNKRLQEVTLEGGFVRCIGEGCFGDRYAGRCAYRTPT